MADQNPRDRASLDPSSSSPLGDDIKTQDAVLCTVLREHSAQLTVAALTRELIDYRPGGCKEAGES
jgi:hypothetical protein